MNIRWVDSWKEIYSSTFQAFWRTLSANAKDAHVFFSPELVYAWLDTYRPIRHLTPCFLIIEDNNNTLFWPLVIWKRNWKSAFCRSLIAVGYSDFDYAEPIVSGDREKLLSHAMQTIRARKDYDTIGVAGLKDFEGLEKEEQFCPICDLSTYQNGDDFLQKARKSLREDVRRQLNRAKEQGELIFENCTLEQALEELPDFLEAHRGRWPHAYKAPHFHENLLKFGIPSDLVRFDRLTLNGSTVAWHLGYHYNQRFYYYMPANRVEFQKLSPGKLLLFKLVERSILERDVIFDHLRGDENYKSGWTNQIQSLWKLSQRRYSLPGRCKFFFMDKIRPLFV